MSTVSILTSLLRKKQQAVHSVWNQVLQWMIREVFEEEQKSIAHPVKFFEEKNKEETSGEKDRF